MLYLLSGYLNW